MERIGAINDKNFNSCKAVYQPFRRRFQHYFDGVQVKFVSNEFPSRATKSIRHPNGQRLIRQNLLLHAVDSLCEMRVN